jgi:hypothetical protein
MSLTLMKIIHAQGDPQHSQQAIFPRKKHGQVYVKYKIKLPPLSRYDYKSQSYSRIPIHPIGKSDFDIFDVSFCQTHTHFSSVTDNLPVTA